MTSPDLTRSGECACCGIAVSLHFDGGNRSLTCAVARRRFLDQSFEPHATATQESERHDYVLVSTPEPMFERRRGAWGG